MTEQPNLFAHLNARTSDPRTSHTAAQTISGTDRATVLRVFREQESGLADFQLEEMLGGSMNGKWRKRRSDLQRDHLLRDSGRTTINPVTHLPVVVWELNSPPNSTE